MAKGYISFVHKESRTTYCGASCVHRRYNCVRPPSPARGCGVARQPIGGVRRIARAERRVLVCEVASFYFAVI